MLGFCQGFNGLPPAFPMGNVSVSLPPELLRGELTEQHWDEVGMCWETSPGCSAWQRGGKNETSQDAAAFSLGCLNQFCL